MAAGVQSASAMQWLPEMQDRVLINTGIRLELTSGLAQGVIGGVERLCMFFPGCWKPTVGVSAWAWCGHCGTQLTRLGPVQKEVQYYSASLSTGLCLHQIQVTRRAEKGCASPASAVKELLSDSAESEPQEDKVGHVGEACSLVRDPETVSGQSLEETPEEPAGSKSLVVPVWKEPQSREGYPSGELDRVNKGRAVDWGSPQVLEKYDSIENLFEWSSPEEA